MGWTGILYTMIALPFGMNFVNLAFNKWSAKPWLKKYLNLPIASYLSIKDSYIRYPLYGLTIASILAFVYTFLNLDNILLYNF